MANLRVNKIAAVGVSTENTGSVFFDGVQDHLSIADSDDFSFGSGDFTIEGFIYPTGIPQGSYATLVTPGYSLQTYFMSSNSLSLYVSSNGGSYDMISTANATGTDSIFQNEWSHFALTRSSNTFRYFINGIEKYTNTVSGTIYNDLTPLGIGDYTPAPATYEFQGYMSNIRICKGHAVYTENFTVPTRELEVHPETVFLGLYDGENIFAEKTGKVIVAHGDRTSSPTPTATDSPIGITTFNPGLTRNVDPTAGPTFQGGAGFVSQNWLTLPKGTTEERFPNFATNAVSDGSARGVFGGGDPHVNTIEYITIATLGNGTDFGDLTRQSGALDGNGCASRTRGIIAGGNIAPSTSAATNTIDYITITSTGDATNFGDLTQARQQAAGISNSTRAVFAGGYFPSTFNVIDYVTIATTGDATDYGDLIQGLYASARGASPVRGVIAGSNSGGAENSIVYVTIATTGNAKDFGDLSESRFRLSGCSNSTRSVFGGGITPSNTQTIEFVTISTSGNGQDFGDLYKHNQRGNTASSSTRGIFAGGSQPSSAGNVIQYIAIPTTGNSIDFGDLVYDENGLFGLSNAHGGLG